MCVCVCARAWLQHSSAGESAGESPLVVPVGLLPRYARWTPATGTWCHGSREGTGGREGERNSH